MLFVLRKSVIFQIRYKSAFRPILSVAKMLLSKIFAYRIKTFYFLLARKSMADYFVICALVLCIELFAPLLCALL